MKKDNVINVLEASKFVLIFVLVLPLIYTKMTKKHDIGHGYTYPDVQYMDNNYSRYYFVPWPDCQKFQELDEEQVYVIPAFIGEQQGCFVDADWVGHDYSYEDDV